MGWICQDYFLPRWGSIWFSSEMCFIGGVKSKRTFTIIYNWSSYYCSKKQQIDYHYFCDFVGKIEMYPLWMCLQFNLLAVHINQNIEFIHLSIATSWYQHIIITQRRSYQNHHSDIDTLPLFRQYSWLLLHENWNRSKKTWSG